MKTLELLDAVKARHSLPSDYAAAKLLSITHSTISKWRNRGGTMDDETALKVAELLELQPEIVLTWVYAERSKCPAARAALEHAAEVLKGAAAVLVLGLALAVTALPHDAAAAHGPEHCILC